MFCLQIVGEYEKVKSSLFQVTSRLRDNFFSSTTPEEAGPRQHSYLAMPSSSPYGRCTTPESDNSSELSFTNQNNRPGFVRKVGGYHKPKLPHEQVILIHLVLYISMFSFLCFHFDMPTSPFNLCFHCSLRRQEDPEIWRIVHGVYLERLLARKGQFSTIN